MLRFPRIHNRTWGRITMLQCARWRLGFLWLIVTAAPAAAQDCHLPAVFQHQFQNDATLSLSAANAGDPCTLTVALNAGAGQTASSFLHYRRPSPAQSIRYGFRIDTKGLTNFGSSNLLHGFQLFSASSPLIIDTGYLPSHLVLLSVNGGNPNPTLRLYAARSGFGSPVIIPMTQTLNTVRVEINVGAGSAGFVRYWFNAGFDDPPTGSIDNGGAGLDNAAWLGVIAAEVGVSSASAQFRSDYAGSTIVLDQIESSDDTLFWTDFESSLQ